MNTLQRRFDDAARALGATKDTSDVFASIEAAYREPHRGYHDLTHIEHCLRVLDSVSLRAPAEVELAIWFHDVIYEPKPGADNEARSAARARDACAQMGVRPDAAERVAKMVLASADHQVTEDDGDLAAFLDIDLAVLGESPTLFEHFEVGVRREWSWVPDEIYAAKRSEILRGFLAREPIYRTPALRARFETQARANLALAVGAWGHHRAM